MLSVRCSARNRRTRRRWRRQRGSTDSKQNRFEVEMETRKCSADEPQFAGVVCTWICVMHKCFAEMIFWSEEGGRLNLLGGKWNQRSQSARKVSLAV